MTAIQIIREIEALPAEEQREVLRHFKDREVTEAGAAPVVRYLDLETARPMIKDILTEHAKLFRKLSQ
jgi:hypothetical protein